MSKNIILPIVISAFAAFSCQIIDDNNDINEWELASFSYNLTTNVIVEPILSLNQCLINKDDIFKEGFKKTVNGMTITLVSAKDSTWRAVNDSESDNLKFTSDIKMLKSDISGRPCWQCSSECSYIEDSKYLATLETIKAATTTWEESITPSSTTLSMLISGSFQIKTYLRNGNKDEFLNEFTATYDNTDINYYPSTYVSK